VENEQKKLKSSESRPAAARGAEDKPAAERLKPPRSEQCAGNDSREAGRPRDTDGARAEKRPGVPAGTKDRQAPELPDVSGQFKFREFTQAARTYKEASGRLSVPGEVQAHRKMGEQTRVAGGTGDDAGHLIAARFGAPGDARNLSPQNWVQNRGEGTYYALEKSWERKLKAGTTIDVTVRDCTRRGEDRPFGRVVTWTETAKDGTRTKDRRQFINPHTSQSRQRQGIEAKPRRGQPAEVHQLPERPFGGERDKTSAPPITDAMRRLKRT
jgi:hypothetical protein